jgi:transcriptional regulator with XRE-family HTH domain
LKGYSINELAERAGISKSYLSYIERGIQKNPSLYILSKIANSLETNIEELLGENKLQPEIEEFPLEEEWNLLLHELIKLGITKEEFSLYLDFYRYKKQRIQ